MDNNKISTTILYAICDNIDNLHLKIIDSISDIVEQIPDSHKILKELEEFENAKKEYALYDQPVSSELNIEKENITLKDNTYYGICYINTCSWFIDELEKIIARMKSENKKKMSITYEYEDISDIQVGLIFHNKQQNKHIDEIHMKWKEHNYEHPYSFISNMFSQKGYMLNYSCDIKQYKTKFTYNKLFTYTLNVDINLKRQRDEV